jgi:hypothetical protein
MENQLYFSHKEELILLRLPHKGKRYSIEDRIRFVMELIRQRVEWDKSKAEFEENMYWAIRKQNAMIRCGE